MFYEVCEKGLILRIRLTPNASTSGVWGVYIDSEGKEFLKVNVNSIPEKGKANQELIKILAKTMRIAKSSIEILSGATDRNKKIIVKENCDELVRFWNEYTFKEK